MRKIRLTEKDLNRLVSKVLQEQKSDRYMFFSNLQQIRRQMDILLEMDPSMIEEVLEDGHDWAQDHIATAKESIDQVFDFFMNKDKEEDVMVSNDDMMESKKKKHTKKEVDEMIKKSFYKSPIKSLVGNVKMNKPIGVINSLGSTDMAEGETTEGKKKTGTKLCARGKASAKAKYEVWPSAYSSGYAVQVCKGTKPGLDGKKRCSPPYC
tara:strand:- start:1426 stop:2052 length:627 start_codon:yes stop_codon:yes gene_type:complete